VNRLSHPISALR